MHFTPRPRWLMIVSMAIVVLPVLRSPMISSRWPRPIGVIESMALMPVCSGSRTRSGAVADRRHRVDGLEAGLQRLVHRLAAGDARRLDLHAPVGDVGQRPAAVDRL